MNWRPTKGEGAQFRVLRKSQQSTQVARMQTKHTSSLKSKMIFIEEKNNSGVIE